MTLQKENPYFLVSIHNLSHMYVLVAVIDNVLNPGLDRLHHIGQKMLLNQRSVIVSQVANMNGLPDVG